MAQRTRRCTAAACKHYFAQWYFVWHNFVHVRTLTAGAACVGKPKSTHGILHMTRKHGALFFSGCFTAQCPKVFAKRRLHPRLFVTISVTQIRDTLSKFHSSNKQMFCMCQLITLACSFFTLKMSCGKGACLCGDSPCPKPAGVSGTLGFKTPSCCTVPCPKLPLVMVSFCLQINDTTCATIQQGCLTAIVEGACSVKYSWGSVESSWGRSCRIIHVQRAVPRDSFFRIRLCACSGCEPACGSTDEPHNALLNFLVDGVDISDRILAANIDPETAGCLYSGCIEGTAGACCATGEQGSVPTWTDLTDLKIGTEIVVGPLGRAL